jgi:hypothetical protein
MDKEDEKKSNKITTLDLWEVVRERREEILFDK